MLTNLHGLFGVYLNFSLIGEPFKNGRSRPEILAPAPQRWRALCQGFSRHLVSASAPLFLTGSGSGIIVPDPDPAKYKRADT